MTRLLLIRHAQPVEDARGRCYGRLDLGLSEQGRADARALAARVSAEPLAAVVSSPALRARETAVPVAAAHGIEIEVVDHLRELDFGELEGKTYDEIASSMPALYAQWMAAPTTVCFPGGEGYDDLRERAGSAVADLRRRYPRQSVAVVTHGGVIRAIVAGMLELAPERIFRLSIEPASVSTVEWVQDEPTINGLNRVSAAPGSPSTITGEEAEARASYPQASACFP